MPLIRDAAGQIIPLGRVIRTFDDPLVPGQAFAYQPGTATAWLVGDQGSASFSSIAISTGQVTSTTAASTNALARIRTNFAVTTAQFKEIVWTVEGLVCSVDSPIVLQMGISLNTLHGGVDLIQNSGSDSLARIQTTDGAGAVTSYTSGINMRLVDGPTVTAVGQARHQKNLTMRLQPNNNGKVLVYILEDDQDIAYADVTASFLGGAWFPYVMLTTLENVAHSFSASRFKLTLIH